MLETLFLIFIIIAGVISAVMALSCVGRSQQVVENHKRPAPIDAKPGDTIIFLPIERED